MKSSNTSRNALAPTAHHVDSYYAATVTEAVSALPLEGTQDCEVCVIGGGFSGLSAALHLARKGVSVVLLEQSLLGWGASGRNGGQAHMGMRRNQQWIESHLGLGTARAQWQLGLRAREHLDWLIKVHAIRCGQPRRRRSARKTFSLRAMATCADFLGTLPRT